ncbi:unnamed protein product [Rotaria sp. Silwood2]|nr:unnamed protein product [Rotaria sp. Silwood2]CAF4547153.1 unnamed protein product [Rotaria sp. Silwood2]
MGDESGDSEKSDSTISPMPTSNKLKINKEIDVTVGDDDAKISFTTIKTDGLGPCHFFLLTGFLQTRFCYLEHTSKDYPTSIHDALSTVIQIMKNIADDLLQMFTNQFHMNYNDFQFNQIHTLELLVGGSVPLYPDLIYNGFMLLNNHDTNMEIQYHIRQNLHHSKSNEEFLLYLVNELKGNIKILSPITYFTSQSSESQGNQFILAESNKADDAPGVFIIYDYETHFCNLGIEWIGSSEDFPLACLYMDLNNKYEEEPIWEIQHEQINMAESRLDPKSTEWENFHYALGTGFYLFYLIPSCSSYEEIVSYVQHLSVQYSRALFLTANIETCSSEVKKYSIGAEPTFLFFRGCKQIHRLEGFNKETIEETIKRYYKIVTPIDIKYIFTQGKGIIMGANDRLVKMEIDYSSVVDQKLKECDEIMKDTIKLIEVLDRLLPLEKQTRTAADTISTGRVLVAIIKYCYQAKQWEQMNEHIVTLSKRRSQLKQAITKMVQEAYELVEKTPDLDTKLKLIETLRTVTTGKIFVENERARLTKN